MLTSWCNAQERKGPAHDSLERLVSDKLYIKWHHTLEKLFLEGTREGRRAGEDPEGDGRRTLANGWESRLWRLEDKNLREGSSVRQFGRPRPLRIRHGRRRYSIPTVAC